MDFVAYPDVSNADLLAALFHEAHIASGREFLISRNFDSAATGKQIYDMVREYGGKSPEYGDELWDLDVAVFSESWTILCNNSEDNIAVSFTIHSNNVWVNLSIDSHEQAEAFFEKLEEGLPPVGNVEDLSKIDVRFWMLGGANPTSQLRTLDTFHWDDVERNYPVKVREQLDDLMNMPVPQVGGKLILWHGHPGGGKTSAIKTLVDAWREWANAEYIVDPEAFFGSAAYMISVLNRGTSQSEIGGSDMWRLIVVEDAGQFVNKNADTNTGQAFSRLLNVTDGMIGQGMRVIVLITTNQPLSEMHEALSRPGRCLANVEFSKFSAKEANEWFGSTVTTSEMSLAELYESQKKTQIKTVKEESNVGQYL